mmetsp:Transcript_12486/g.36832  ORF Transcript_12486/g.36832 Transcript_12486/m.36832 type:complete len:243 (+) Transcript_12486:1377-2105(+)
MPQRPRQHHLRPLPLLLLLLRRLPLRPQWRHLPRPRPAGPLAAPATLRNATSSWLAGVPRIRATARGRVASSGCPPGRLRAIARPATSRAAATPIAALPECASRACVSLVIMVQHLLLLQLPPRRRLLRHPRRPHLTPTPHAARKGSTNVSAGAERPSLSASTAGRKCIGLNFSREIVSPRTTRALTTPTGVAWAWSAVATNTTSSASSTLLLLPQPLRQPLPRQPLPPPQRASRQPRLPPQ